jgi:hypothetical protein
MNCASIRSHGCSKEWQVLIDQDNEGWLAAGFGQPCGLGLRDSIFFFFFLYLFIACWGLNSGPTPWATLPALFFVMGFFKIGSLEIICLDWLWTVIFLVSASWVGRSHPCLAPFSFYCRKICIIWNSQLNHSKM